MSQNSRVRKKTSTARVKNQTTENTRDFVNNVLESLEKKGHNTQNFILLHSGLGSHHDDLVNKVSQKTKIRSIRSASHQASNILSEKKLKCVKNTTGKGDPEKIISGHAIKLLYEGKCPAILVDTKKPFDLESLQSGVMFLPKHWTEKTETKTIG